MSDEVVDQDVLHSLCQEASALVGRLPARVSRVSISAGEYQVKIEWEPSGQVVTTVAGAPGAPVTAGAVGGAAPAADAPVVPDNRHAIVAVLVGTFYRSAEPGAAPFVEVGDVVNEGQDVAIIEAMKVMNRIQADQAGRVAEILVENGEMVEFEQPIIILEPIE